MVSERRTFGERLKRHRERCGVTLESISRSTKVSVSLFVGLERGDCSRWPAGLYSRSYIRSYAEAVGLNPNDTVEEFSAVFGDTPTTPQPAGVPASIPPPAAAGHLRLAIAEDSGANGDRIARRAALVAAELVVGFLIASIAHVGLGANVWVTVSCVLAYHAGGRLVSEESLLYWMYLRSRHRAVQTVEIVTPPQPDNVRVATTASTTA